ncbi:hypothetical protein ACTMTJ_27220 [Phytohabitans sp. LJ34]
MIGLLAIVPLTRIWDRAWWIRVLGALLVLALGAASVPIVVSRVPPR